MELYFDGQAMTLARYPNLGNMNRTILTHPSLYKLYFSAHFFFAAYKIQDAILID
jgi:hypothetical protein